jgi:hypothetical protein
MRRLISSLLMATFAPLLAADSLQARVISIQSQIQTSIENEVLIVNVKITNQGDEDAKSVYVEIASPKSTFRSPTQPGLSPGASLVFISRHATKQLSPGQYPLILRTHYGDANNYPFSAVSLASFQKGDRVETGIVPALENQRLVKRARTRLSIKNLDDAEKKLHVRFPAPDELTIQPGSLDSSIGSNQEITLPLQVTNFSALAGSTYMVYAVIEWERNGIHATVFAPASFYIDAPSLLSVIAGHWSAVLIILLFVVGLIGARVYWERRKPK